MKIGAGRIFAVVLIVFLVVPAAAHEAHDSHENSTSDSTEKDSDNPFSSLAEEQSFTENMVIVEIAIVSLLTALALKHYFRN